MKPEATRYKKEEMLRALKCNKNAKATTRILIPFPKACVHSNHVTVDSGFTHRIHRDVKNEIYRLVGMGITTVPIVQRMLHEFARKKPLCFLVFQTPPHDQAYFPKASIIWRHIRAALVAGQYTILTRTMRNS